MNPNSAGPHKFDEIWGSILSQNEEIVTGIIQSLSKEELNYIRDHLRKMAYEDDWHPSQQKSALFALSIIDSDAKQ